MNSKCHSVHNVHNLAHWAHWKPTENHFSTAGTPSKFATTAIASKVDRPPCSCGMHIVRSFGNCTVAEVQRLSLMTHGRRGPQINRFGEENSLTGAECTLNKTLIWGKWSYGWCVIKSKRCRQLAMPFKWMRKWRLFHKRWAVHALLNRENVCWEITEVYWLEKMAGLRASSEYQELLEQSGANNLSLCTFLRLRQWQPHSVDAQSSSSLHPL